jgi:hypothetical protein
MEWRKSDTEIKLLYKPKERKMILLAKKNLFHEASPNHLTKGAVNRTESISPHSPKVLYSCGS